ncbi:thiamine biosynthesis protein ThiS [Candidatus Poribacteria bacterium]|nr:MAG: thiamine biosynthesis protein ThiS [Candidatus Poribacteria bacterium]
MKININGEEKSVLQEINVYDLLINIELDPQQSGIAVAIDREVIPKSQWKTTVLKEGSEVEIIRAVQGG